MEARTLSTLYDSLAYEVSILLVFFLSWVALQIRKCGKRKPQKKVSEQAERPIEDEVSTPPKVRVGVQPVNSASSLSYPDVLQEIISCNDKQRGRALDLYQLHRKRIKSRFTSLEPAAAEKVFFNFCMAAARTGDMANLEMLLKDMGEAGVARTTNLYSNVCKMITAKRMFEEALVLWRWMHRDQVEIGRSTKSCLLFAATQSKAHELAMEFFEQLRKGKSASAADYGNACRVLTSTGRQVEAAKLVREMHDRDIEPYKVTYQMVFSACCVDGQHLELAHEIFSHMQKFSGLCDSVMYNMLIKGHVQANQLDDAFNWFDIMRQEGVDPSSVTFGILLDGCIDKAKMERASQVFQTMIACGFAMNAVLFTTMIKGFGKAGKIKDALQLYETMISQGIEPDNCIYSTLVKCLCDNKDLESAFLIVDEMSNKGFAPDEVIFNNLLAGCVQCSNLTLGEKLLQDMMKFGIQPSMTSMSILMKLYSKCRAWQQAFDLLQTTEARFGVRPEQRLYVQLINTCLSVRKGNLALQTFLAMRDVFGLPEKDEIAKIVRIGTQQKLVEESLKIVQTALNDGVKLRTEHLDMIHEVAIREQHKSVISNVKELAKLYGMRLQ